MERLKDGSQITAVVMRSRAGRPPSLEDDLDRRRQQQAGEEDQSLDAVDPEQTA